MTRAVVLGAAVAALGLAACAPVEGQRVAAASDRARPASPYYPEVATVAYSNDPLPRGAQELP
ncbi:hypothetical protein [Sphingomicrobium astaxanthinifaciens]|uniref:hypothetical protein n=1 Tax=Sphingomicrobium astaxanthinifaciens TaxID=1227949 RepID=UPI001FCA55B5|nr:hypothetical protein [Sphingomicrobium astaxanthinifaciens]MCJ7421706.1 hypothetical protein [Sphingomicrobium astaxanthinifaciens]